MQSSHASASGGVGGERRCHLGVVGVIPVSYYEYMRVYNGVIPVSYAEYTGVILGSYSILASYSGVW